MNAHQEELTLVVLADHLALVAERMAVQSDLSVASEADITDVGEAMRLISGG